MKGLAGKGRLHNFNEGIVLLVRNPTSTPYFLLPVGRTTLLLRLLGDEPVRNHAPLLKRLNILQACPSTASYHIDTACTLHRLERFYWWIRTSACARWWLRQEVPSAEETAIDGWLACHLDLPPSGTGNRRQGGPFRATGYAPG